jgi:hypothetical protein
MKLNHIIGALRNGAVLHFDLADKPRWELYDGATIRTVSTTQVESLIKRGAIVSAGDGLFADIPSQTWLYANNTQL